MRTNRQLGDCDLIRPRIELATDRMNPKGRVVKADTVRHAETEIVCRVLCCREMPRLDVFRRQVECRHRLLIRAGHREDLGRQLASFVVLRIVGLRAKEVGHVLPPLNRKDIVPVRPVQPMPSVTDLVDLRRVVVPVSGKDRQQIGALVSIVVRVKFVGVAVFRNDFRNDQLDGQVGWLILIVIRQILADTDIELGVFRR